ncbi:hypothetical protein VTO73DRAFT_8394 [Trametes versicolor]
MTAGSQHRQAQSVHKEEDYGIPGLPAHKSGLQSTIKVLVVVRGPPVRDIASQKQGYAPILRPSFLHTHARGRRDCHPKKRPATLFGCIAGRREEKAAGKRDDTSSCHVDRRRTTHPLGRTYLRYRMGVYGTEGDSRKNRKRECNSIGHPSSR